jgi:hypothetical protein
MKRAFAGLLLLLPFLVGCLGGVPLDRYCYVLDLGVERGDALPYRFVFLLNEDTAGSGEDGGGRGQVSMVSAEERSLFAAIDALAGALPAQLSFERTTLLAFSRELAESGDMQTVLEGNLSRLKIRQNVRVIVVEKDLRGAFQGLVSEGDPSMNRLKTNVQLFEENYGYVEDWGLRRLQEAFANETGDVLLPYAALVGDPPRKDMVGGEVYPYLGGTLLGEGQIRTSLAGSAVFAGKRMTGVLSGQHTMLVLMGKGGFRAGHLRLPWRDGTEMDLALYALERPKRNYAEGVFSCNIVLEADLENPSQTEADSKELIAAMESYLEGELQRVFRAAAEEGADVFEVGREALSAFDSWESWREYGFSRRLPKIEAVFQVRVKLSHSPRDPALE